MPVECCIIAHYLPIHRKCCCDEQSDIIFFCRHLCHRLLCSIHTCYIIFSFFSIFLLLVYNCTYAHTKGDSLAFFVSPRAIVFSIFNLTSINQSGHWWFFFFSLLYFRYFVHLVNSVFHFSFSAKCCSCFNSSLFLILSV